MKNCNVIGPNKHICDTFKLGTLFSLKMAAQNIYFKTKSYISKYTCLKYLCNDQLYMYMLFDTINTFLILLNWSDDVSENGGQKLKSLQKIHDINLLILATNAKLMCQ